MFHDFSLHIFIYFIYGTTVSKDGSILPFNVNGNNSFENLNFKRGLIILHSVEKTLTLGYIF